MEKRFGQSNIHYRDLDLIPLAVDCIIFGFNNNALELLLVHRNIEPKKGKWSLMGGFIKKEEGLHDAAHRILFQLTGLNNIYMEQVETFGDVDRDPGGRVVSVAYYALILKEEYNEKLVEEYNASWFSLNELPEMIFDHKTMVEKALKRLQQKIKTGPIGFNLLPEKFTLPQLQSLYEVILGETLDKRNFRKKLFELDILEKLDEKDYSSSKKGAFLYRFNKEKYKSTPVFKM